MTRDFSLYQHTQHRVNCVLLKSKGGYLSDLTKATKKGLFTRAQIQVIKKIESERALNGFWNIIE